MDKKSKYFFMAFFILIGVVVSVTYYKYFVWRDYYIVAEAECDPEQEICFMYQCDPKEDKDCPEDPEEQISYYGKTKKKAYAIPPCDPEDENCPPLSCTSGEDCEMLPCKEENISEGEECSNPEEYKEEFGSEEEEDSEEEVDEEGCPPDDEECLEEDASSDNSEDSGEGGDLEGEENEEEISQVPDIRLGINDLNSSQFLNI